MLKKYVLAIFTFWVGLVLISSTASAISLIVNPHSQDVLQGSLVEISIDIADLGLFAAPSLSTFDLDLSFDSSILSLNNVVFGDPILGNQLDQFGMGTVNSFSETTPGVANLWELSFDFPDTLDVLQYDSFTLATLTFDTLNPGISSLDISSYILGDASGNSLTSDLVGGSVTVNPVPEPGTILLLGFGMFGMLGFIGIKKRIWKA